MSLRPQSIELINKILPPHENPTNTATSQSSPFGNITNRPNREPYEHLGHCRGAILLLELPISGVTGQITEIDVQAFCQVSQAWLTVHSFTALTISNNGSSASQYAFLVYPSTLDASQWAAKIQGPMPRLFRVNVVGTGNLVYKLSAELLS